MRNNDDIVIISVESRKGGVGKTTMSLWLAYWCLNLRDSNFLDSAPDFDYEVVFFDLDITGTSSFFLEETFLWKDQIHLVKELNKKKTKEKKTKGEKTKEEETKEEETKEEETKEKHKPLDLVDLFESYMTGERIQGFTLNKTDENQYLLESGKINIFSSFLDPDEEKNVEGKKKEEKKKEKGFSFMPSALFDPVHSAFFVKMLKTIAEKCCAVLCKDIEEEKEKVKVKVKKKRLLVVIDNSPGFSGLEPTVDDWLTDFGPDVGKVLFVGSLDPQDLEACMKGLKRVYSLFDDKIKTSLQYNQDVALTVQLENKEQKSFYLRLIETEPWKYKKGSQNSCSYPPPDKKRHKHCSLCGLCFYRHNLKPDNLTADYVSAFIINKAHPAIASLPGLYNISSILNALNIKSENSNKVLSNFNNILEEIEAESSSDLAGFKSIAPVFFSLKIIPYDSSLSAAFFKHCIKIIKTPSGPEYKEYYYKLKILRDAPRIFDWLATEYIDIPLAERTPLVIENLFKFDDEIVSVKKALEKFQEGKEFLKAYFNIDLCITRDIARLAARIAEFSSGNGFDTIFADLCFIEKRDPLLDTPSIVDFANRMAEIIDDNFFPNKEQHDMEYYDEFIDPPVIMCFSASYALAVSEFKDKPRHQIEDATIIRLATFSMKVLESLRKKGCPPSWLKSENIFTAILNNHSSDAQNIIRVVANADPFLGHFADTEDALFIIFKDFCRLASRVFDIREDFSLLLDYFELFALLPTEFCNSREQFAKVEKAIEETVTAKKTAHGSAEIIMEQAKAMAGQKADLSEIADPSIGLIKEEIYGEMKECMKSIITEWKLNTYSNSPTN